MNSKKRNLQRKYWDNFYANWVINIPSQFGVFVATELEDRSVIVEFGSGNGRDSLYFASLGHMVVAMDISQEAIQKCNQAMNDQGFEHAEFILGDISKIEDVHQAIEIAREYAKRENNKLVFYSRFLLHSLDETQERNFLDSIYAEMQSGERIYFEFRSKEDAVLEKHYGNHYRRYVDTERFVNQLKNKLELDINYEIVGRGMAKYKEEDPFVARIIASKK